MTLIFTHLIAFVFGGVLMAQLLAMLRKPQPPKKLESLSNLERLKEARSYAWRAYDLCNMQDNANRVDYVTAAAQSFVTMLNCQINAIRRQQSTLLHSKQHHDNH